MVSLLERSCHQNYKQYIVAVVVVAVAIVTTVVVVEAAVVVVVVVVVVEVVAAVAVVCAAWRKATTSVGDSLPGDTRLTYFFPSLFLPTTNSGMS